MTRSYQTAIIDTAIEHPEWTPEQRAEHLQRDALDLDPADRTMLRTSPLSFVARSVDHWLRYPYIIRFVVQGRTR